MTCEELQPLLTPYVDGEASPADRERVAGHLAACRDCAARAAKEHAARRLMQVRGRHLAPAAPAALRARCAALAGTRPHPARTTASWLSWRGLRLAGATAVVAVTGVIGYGALAHSATLLVAGLTLDHLKCFAFLEGRSGPADARALEAKLEREYGWHLSVPPGAAGERLALVGARRCLSSDGTIAHVMYRHGGKPVSLFVLPDTARGARAMSFAGYPARIWSRGDRTYILVASESDAAVRPVAAYFRAAVN